MVLDSLLVKVEWRNQNAVIVSDILNIVRTVPLSLAEMGKKNKLTCEICWKIVILEPPAFQGHVKSDFVVLGMNIILTAPCGGGPHADRRIGTVCTLGSLWANECTSHLQGELEAD